MNTPDSVGIHSTNDKHIGIIILAAGVSSRLGKAKQLLKHRDEQTLIKHTCQSAIASGLHPIVLVLGARKEIILEEVEGLAVAITINNHWSQGISTSIKKGLDEILLLDPNLEAVIYLVCDQPYLDTEMIQKLVSTYYTTGKPMVACGYSNVIGIPVLFNRSSFVFLNKLEGDKGASKIIYQYPDQVAVVSFEQGGMDIDTDEDYRRYKIKIPDDL